MLDYPDTYRKQQRTQSSEARREPADSGILSNRAKTVRTSKAENQIDKFITSLRETHMMGTEMSRRRKGKVVESVEVHVIKL